jgi:hypothetical protein
VDSSGPYRGGAVEGSERQCVGRHIGTMFGPMTEDSRHLFVAAVPGVEALGGNIDSLLVTGGQS